MTRFTGLLTACVVLATITVGCRRGERALADLETTSGAVTRDHARAVGRFVPASSGAEFFLGDAVRTSERSSAKLKLFDGSRLDLEERTLIRFRKSGSESRRRFDLEAGEAVLSSTTDELTFDTSFGTAMLAPGTRVRLTRRGQLVRFEVEVGSAIIEGQGKRSQLEARGVVELEVGLAQLEGPAAPPEPSAAPSASSDVSAEAPNPPAEELAGSRPGTVELEPATQRRTLTLPGGTIVIEPGARLKLSTDRTGTQVEVAEGSAQIKGARSERALIRGDASRLERSGELKDVRQHGPAYHELASGAGDSFVVHDPHPPVVVGFPLPAACAGQAALRIDGAGPTFIGETGVNASFRAGRHRYTLSCLGKDGAPDGAEHKGTITVLADGGSRKLPTSAPETTVDTDGRTYTVLYQNRLPRLVARWPKAPEAASYSLQVSSAGKSRTLSGGAPRLIIEAGSLGEGLHQLTFEGGGRRSRTTSVDIRFDNATPTASIAGPADRSFGPGAQVQVAGTALPGWSVSIAGNELPQDAQNRFSGQATVPGTGALTIRFAHPQRGVHYYLRRPGGGT